MTVTSVDCPAEHLICCEGFTMLSGQCIRESLFYVKIVYVKQSLISSFARSCYLCVSYVRLITMSITCDAIAVIESPMTDHGIS